jgi:superfamily II RNA helicase
MVKICSYQYPTDSVDEYKKYHDLYPYELHDFQKWSIQSIVTGNHVLVCCPTGSGKTLPGEFAIQYFQSIGKKVIYTSPLKALSNEKFYNFTEKYPNISVGLITGDIKTNPDADCLIMTTEILLNKLYAIKSQTHMSSFVSFDMDIEHELGCVVFDEIHFINDEHRGHVWEQCIMLLPKQVQIIGLSATLDNPEKFARWMETKGNNAESTDIISIVPEKQVYLTQKKVRAVPLIHYSFITVTQSIHKAVKDKVLQEEIRNLTNKPFVIQDAKGVFNDGVYSNMTKMMKLFDKHDVRVKRQFVLNKVAEYLVQQEMLPALCYVFSRRQLEKCAEEMTTNLLEFDSKVPYTVDRECEQIIRKLSNYEEYLHLPEYVNTVKLLRKGVGIHHAGLIPILREMTELLFARGFIKILFCTETMSVGINLPVKTTIFTDICKFNGDVVRTLHGHEYTQAAGRAGRLGLDTVGHVIHLNNLFRSVDSVSYKTMMNGKPQALVSKFKISYNLLLNLLDIGDRDITGFAEKSMITDNLESQQKHLQEQIKQLDAELENSGEVNTRTPVEIILQYIDLQKVLPYSANKKRKEVERQVKDLQENYRYIEQDKLAYEKVDAKKKEKDDLQEQYIGLKSYFSSGVGAVLELLKAEGFIAGPSPTTTPLNMSRDSATAAGATAGAGELTLLGKIAAQIRELHCLTFAKLYMDGTLDKLTTKQLVALFSCFTNIKVIDELKDNVPKSNDPTVNDLVSKIFHLYDDYKYKEYMSNINTGFDYDMHYDLLGYVEKWCDTEDVVECKSVLQELGEKKEIFLGELVKALLKINNISCEMEKLAEMTNNMDFLSKLREIPRMTLKYVITNQSLYV